MKLNVLRNLLLRGYGVGGRVKEASRTKWFELWMVKFYELVPILTWKGASLKLRENFYRVCVVRVQSGLKRKMILIL